MATSPPVERDELIQAMARLGGALRDTAEWADCQQKSPQKFAEAALYLLDDANLRATLSQNGRAYVEQHHDWRDVTDRLVRVYERAIATYARKNALFSTHIKSV